jgi:predicted O-methyltransferase YrrM
MRSRGGKRGANAVQHFPWLDALPGSVAQGVRELAPLYQRYVNIVSSSVWAVSLESAGLLHALCRLTRPRAILDLGSGFSSAVLRMYARDAPLGCVVHSVDDDPQWLERSREFLQSLDLSDEGLLLWSERSRLGSAYDLIFHDMGSMALRQESLGFVLAHRAASGLIVLDDMHKTPYGAIAAQTCADAGLRVVTLRELTADVYGRFASLAMAQPGSGA